MSKFDYEMFYGGFDDFAVNKEKHTKEQAIELYKKEMVLPKKYIAIGSAFIRHRAGINDDGEPCVGWWLEYEKHKRSCPVWAFHTAKSSEEKFNKNYEYILIDGGEQK
jgi:hypothetical protein